MMALKFSFVIVTYNNSDTVGACLDSIAMQTRASHEVIVVDNSPNSNTIEVIERYQTNHKNHTIRVIKPETNSGFGRGCNLGANEAKGEYLFILNPDTQLLNDSASELAECLSGRSNAIAAGPAIFDHHGTVTPTCRRLPSLFRIILDATGADSWFGLYKMMYFAHDVSRQVEQIIGAAILIRRCDYERLAGMDPRFFVYYEEVDLCKRIQNAGGALWFWPAAKVQHLGGASCEVGSIRARMIFTLRESRKKYFRKHYGAISAFAVECVNRLEGLGKATLLALAWILKRDRSNKQRAQGFWSVAIGRIPKEAVQATHRVLAFTVKPRESADSRYRMLQYFRAAERDGIHIDHRTLMTARYFQWQIRNVQIVPRLILLPFMLAVRLWQVFYLAPRYDAVWILREMFPVGPPVLEKLLVWRCKRVVLDVDDALHIPDKESSRLWLRVLRDRGKFARMAPSYSSVVCGNAYLGNFYSSCGAAVKIIPTVVDSDRYATCARGATNAPRIGWIGTPLNRHHLEMLAPVFHTLATERSFELVVVGLNEPLQWTVPELRYLNWSLEEELGFFNRFDIGIMPLKDSRLHEANAHSNWSSTWLPVCQSLHLQSVPIAMSSKMEQVAILPARRTSGIVHCSR